MPPVASSSVTSIPSADGWAVGAGVAATGGAVARGFAATSPVRGRSTIVAGAVIGLIGAILVRYYFAARQLGFTVAGKGEIVPV